jgi:integral membrane sensor domain MASE1
VAPHHDLSAGALASAAGFALATLAAALLGIILTRESGDVAVLWPVNGIVAGVLLRLPRERHLVTITACFLANSAANLWHGDPLWVADGLAVCNLLEAVLACQLVLRLTGPAFRLADLHQLSALLAAGLAAPAVSAVVAASVFSPAIGMAPGVLWQHW